MAWEPWLKSNPVRSKDERDEYEFEYSKSDYTKDKKGVFVGPPADTEKNKEDN